MQTLRFNYFHNNVYKNTEHATEKTKNSTQETVQTKAVTAHHLDFSVFSLYLFQFNAIKFPYRSMILFFFVVEEM